MNITNLTATELIEAVQKSELTPEEIAKATIQRVKEFNPKLNAIIRFDPELIIREAKRVSEALAQGKKLPLAGTVFTAKDNIWVKDQIVSQGSLLFKDFIAPKNAYCIEALTKKGAMLLGITNSSEFACKGVTDNLIANATRNPWNLEYTPGGSSGGAASAVSAGFGSFAVATDAGGSVRRPASHTGVFGMKPSQGIIPHHLGFKEPVFGQSVIGLMARCTADIKLTLKLLCAYEPSEPMSCKNFPTKSKSLNELKIAYSPRLGLNYPVDEEVKSLVENAVALLGDAGCHIEEADPNWPEGTDESALMPLQLSALAALYGKQWKDSPELFDENIAAQIEQGLQLSAVDVANAWFLRESLLKVLVNFQKKYDLLITPTTPCTAWPYTELGPKHIENKSVTTRGHAVFTPIFNHTFMPAISVPCGLSSERLPVGLQIIGRRFEDMLVIKAAEEIEKKLNYPFKLPKLF